MTGCVLVADDSSEQVSSECRSRASATRTCPYAAGDGAEAGSTHQFNVGGPV